MNSGEAPELANLLAFTRRFAIPLIGLSSKMDSTLMKQADVHLQIPSLGEACGFGMVPSISTTLTLAMGDALAIALMKHRDFRPENFRDFHPGGKLGAQLSKVRDLMHAGDALPLVSGLMQQGMSQGAALSFIVAGGITSIPAAIAVFALARTPLFLTYIAMALTGSAIAGILYQLSAG